MKQNIRSIIFGLSAVLALAAWIYGIAVYPSGSIREIPLEEFYAFAALFLLYAALLATPLYAAAPNLPGKAMYFRARRALGVSGFGFALLHASIAFFGLLDGFQGIGFLDHRYLVSLFWGLVALVILALLSAVSFDAAIQYMGPWWKRLQRLAYIAGIASLIHVVIIGSHYSNLSSTIPSISFILLIVLLVLESMRLDAYVQRKYMADSRSFGFVFVVFFTLLVLVSYIYVLQAGAGGVGGFSLNIHAQHEKEAALQAEQAKAQQPNAQ
jgi:DMSO/TMAO reductase YedYZ heme-binding membrane subunit